MILAIIIASVIIIIWDCLYYKNVTKQVNDEQKLKDFYKNYDSINKK